MYFNVCSTICATSIHCQFMFKKYHGGLSNVNPVQRVKSLQHDPDMNKERSPSISGVDNSRSLKTIGFKNMLGLERVPEKACHTNQCINTLSEEFHADCFFDCAWQALLHHHNLMSTVRSVSYLPSTKQICLSWWEPSVSCKTLLSGHLRYHLRTTISGERFGIVQDVSPLWSSWLYSRAFKVDVSHAQSTGNYEPVVH